ncbi:hypothetical protein PMZ80_001884 [Knufia obscura]|uniref:Uncharacterized protein n=2 Tax=Knufia TaxID=430999 RepID=A0AAN8EEG6_9EURO|nr:hypothetical protein PMZ80_001884 [Knufia obscura]KAK5953703.1 hypothetical protein OHC33_004972 [Knufia fluminis]
MEIHSVLPEERARNEKGETLPWGYRYADSSKNPRQPEESGPFGRNRSIRYTSSSYSGRRTSTRAGTTPSRTKENSAVSDFSRLFAKEQATRAETASVPLQSETSAETVVVEKVPTECLLYGYRDKNSEWKVISRYERIVQPSIICEDYPREDPMLFTSSNSPMGFNRSNITVHQNLSREALAKSRVYKGGNHWIKITFDSWEAAERACFYSPVEIDGCLVSCEMWSGRGPLVDAPVPKDGVGGGAVGGLISSRKPKTMGPTLGGKASAVAGFEQAMAGTLPRSHTMPDGQFGQPRGVGTRDDMDVDEVAVESSTASSATAMSPPLASGLSVPQQSGAGLRSRSVPNLPSQNASADPSQSVSKIRGVRKVALRPVHEALPPQQSFVERVLRSLPVVSWALGFTTPVKKDGIEKAGEKEKVGLIGEGPVVKEDGTFDSTGNGWYWKLWYTLDKVAGTDFCGLKED